MFDKRCVMAYKTVTKQLVIDFLKSKAETTVSVEEIKNYLSENENNANITTIYRILDKLYENNLLMRFSDEKKKRYTYKYVSNESMCREHIHLKCSNCGKIVHLDCEHSDEFIRHIYNEHGFLLRCDNAILYGLCKNCLKKENS